MQERHGNPWENSVIRYNFEMVITGGLPQQRSAHPTELSR